MSLCLFLVCYSCIFYALSSNLLLLLFIRRPSNKGGGKGGAMGLKPHLN